MLSLEGPNVRLVLTDQHSLNSSNGVLSSSFCVSQCWMVLWPLRPTQNICKFVPNINKHYYKKGILRGLITHAKRFLRGYKYHLRNWWCGSNIARGSFHKGYPSRKLTFRESYTENSRRRSVSARVFHITQENSNFFFNVHSNVYFSHGLPNPVILITAHLLKN